MLKQTTMLDSSLGWMLLACLGVIWVMLGMYWGRKAKNMEGFMLAGRNVGLALGTATAMATWITSNTTMLAPQFAFELGVWGMLAYATASFGLFLFAPLAKRIRQLMPSGYTSGDFIRLRYGKAAWIVFLLISIFYSLTWLISMGMAGGILMNALSGIPYQWGMTAILVVCVLYTLFGGLYAVIGTDYIQSLIILIGIVAVGWGVMNHIGVDEVYTHVSAEQPMLINILLPAAVMAFFNNMLFGIGEIFHSNVWWYSRHPNFFFEWIMWVSYFVFALGSPYGLWAVIAPALMLFLLMKVTGIPLMEERALKNKGAAFREYMRTTSFFVPLPKRV